MVNLRQTIMYLDISLKKPRKRSSIVRKCVYTGIVVMAIGQLLLLYYFYYLAYVKPFEKRVYFVNPVYLENYNDFNFDRVNWTAWIKKPFTKGGKSEIIYHSLLKSRAIKRVAYTNGTVENLGCTRSTCKCRETPHFDRKYQLRINTPPCCREKILNLFQHLVTELHRWRVNYYLVSTALIGWMRNKNFPPYGTELNLVIDYNYWNSKQMSAVMKSLMTSYGHVSQLNEQNTEWKITFSERNKNSILLWPYYTDDNIVTIPHYGNIVQMARNVFPLRKVTFNGIRVYIPKNPEEYLHTHYGVGKWEMELSCENVENGECVRLTRAEKHI